MKDKRHLAAVQRMLNGMPDMSKMEPVKTKRPDPNEPKVLRRQRIKSEIYIEGPIEDVIKMLQDIKAEAEAKGFFDIYVDIHTYIDCHCEEVDINIEGSRYETQEEVQKRLKKSLSAKKSAARRKKNKEEKERKEYERLKAKFEGK